jgi:hypothetical protein
LGLSAHVLKPLLDPEHTLNYLKSLNFVANGLDAHNGELPPECFPPLFENSQSCFTLIDENTQASVEGYGLESDGAFQGGLNKSSPLEVPDGSISFRAVDLDCTRYFAGFGRAGLG